MENVLRRNSRTSGDSMLLLDGGRRANPDAMEDDAEESEQSQKKQRIVVEPICNSSVNIGSDLVGSALPVVVVAEAQGELMGAADEMAMPLHRPARL